MVSAPNVIVPVLVSRLIPVPPDAVELVVPKLSAALDVLTLMPMPVGFVMVVEPLDILPATVVKVMPVVELLVEEMLVKAAVEETGPLNVPVLRLRACPVPVMLVSASVSVPKFVPDKFTAAAAVPLRVTPRIVLPLPNMILLPPESMIGFVPPVVGRTVQPDGVEKPVIVSID